MGWIRHLGAFAGGASAGIRNGVSTKGEMQRQDFASDENERRAGMYKEISEYLNQAKNGTGAFAMDTETAKPAPLAAPPAPTASMRPDDVGPPADIGGGSAAALMQRALPQAAAAQPIPGESMSASGVSGVPATRTSTASKRSLPFFQYLGV